MEEEIENIIYNGEVIEDYPSDKPFPSRLIFSIVDKRPLHLVLAYDEKSETCFVVTSYEPNIERFEIDFKTRKKKP